MRFLHFVPGIRRHSGLPLGVHFDEDPNPVTPPVDPNPVTPPAGDPADKDLIKITPSQMKDRLTRAENDAKAKVLKDLGFETPEEVKARLARATELENEKLTESERLKLDAENATARANEVAATLARVQSERQIEKRNDAIEKVLIANGVTDPEDLEIAMARATKFVTTNLGDELPSATNLKEFVDDLREKKPVLFSGGDAPLNAGPQRKPREEKPKDNTPKPKTQEEINAMSPAEFEAHSALVLSQIR